jgi:chlorobactene glucosyltransferase
MRGMWENVLIPQMAVIGFMFLPLALSNRTRMVRLAIGGGSGNLIRTDFYRAIGGHESLRDAVIDDIALARLTRRRGGTSVLMRADHLISVRMYRGFREIADGFTKNAFSTFDRSYAQTAVAVVTGVLLNIYPYFAALTGSKFAIGTVLFITFSRLILFLTLRYSVLAALFGHPLMTAVWLAITIRSAWRTGIRGELSWRGRTYDASRTRFGAGR